MNPRRKEEVLHTVKMLVFPKLVNLLGLRRICLGHSHPSLSSPPHHSPPFCKFHQGYQRVVLPGLCHLSHTSLFPPLLSNSTCKCSLQSTLRPSGCSCLSASLFSPAYPITPEGYTPVRTGGMKALGGEKGRLEITLGQPECGGLRNYSSQHAPVPGSPAHLPMHCGE